MMPRKSCGIAVFRPFILLFSAALILGGCNQQSDDRNEGVTVELPPPLPPEGFENLETANEATPVELNLARPMIEEQEAPAETKAPPPRDEEEPETSPPPKAKAPESPPPPAKAAEPATTASSTAEPKLTSGRPSLSDATMARTIERIGYACGQIVSTNQVDTGSAGDRVYKITCSSGDSYQATNRDGRMRFRKWTR
jgi:hypothetical protein